LDGPAFLSARISSHDRRSHYWFKQKDQSITLC